MKEHLENNLCFKCHKAGHMSRNCPKGQQVTSSTRDKAPGSKTSYAVRYADSSEPADDAIQVTDGDGDEPEVLDELPCGSVRFRLDEDDQEEGAGADTAFVQDDAVDPFGNPPPYEELRMEAYDAHAWYRRYQRRWYRWIIDYLETRGMTHRVRQTCEAYERHGSDSTFVCPDAVRAHRLERDAFIEGSSRFGDPVANRMGMVVEAQIDRLPHLWEIWTQEFAIDSYMVLSEDGYTPWVMNEPYLSTSLEVPQELLTRRSFDFVGWYRARMLEFVDIAWRFEHDELGMEDVDFFQEWNWGEP
ncbi:hypothetical protein PUNSTDRAFT_139587 [Punctularia strigosozonata HHB-11173 SS5]|uniref:CCHC-type domain-containing protein n=1 Tax=Punctularia strigosozonata (strain HHB-11173) TaxID=741275 RepID=R7S2C1_PUNST|nr:uncharacterized protein PUNSTDRAFT_139587 [Punctularia strigosozonata HHB-11173 SS5]EIN03396.1 hypothetical protein PUNSTDRAFT_139587 [Punctularia strigosozonata HHB-11173 SS5]